MAQPVWVLSVDLQTKTATFQTGLADAAKAARGTFGDIKAGAGEMGGAVGYSMGEARHSVMLLGEEFGVHLPRALTSFIASIGPLGAALEAAFPFLAIAVGATLLIEHLVKMHEAGEKLTEDQLKFATSVQNTYNTLDERLIQAGIKADELRNDHLGALKGQLELIDRQSMAELVHAFEQVAKAADTVMKDLEGHWYTWGRGSEGAKKALDTFQSKYDNLLASGDNEKASGLLHGTLAQAQQVQSLMEVASQKTTGFATDKTDAINAKAFAAQEKLKSMGVDIGLSMTKQLEAQQNLVDALNAQLHVEQQVSALKKAEGNNAKTSEAHGESAQQAVAARQAAETAMRMGQQGVTAEKATADAQLIIHNASLEDRLESDITFAGKSRDVQLQGNTAQIAALDKSGKDYHTQLKALQEKALEITADYEAKVTELKAKALVAENNRDVTLLEQGEREKIENTLKGTSERLSAIDDAIRQEEALNLQGTGFFRALLIQRVQAVRDEAKEEAKLREDAGKEEADNDVKTGQIGIAAEKQRIALADSARHVSMEKAVADEIHLATEEGRIKQQALAKQMAALDKGGKDYQNKLKALQDKERQSVQETENAISAIKDKAQQERNARILAAESQQMNALASGLTQSIMGHQTWAQMITSFGNQAVEGMIKNSLLILMQQDKEKLGAAKTAAANAYKTGTEIGGPAGLILGPVFAAAAFAGVMAFEKGTDSVPGSGHGDVVPAMLTPGEGVVPGGVMDGLRTMARDGGFSQRPGAGVTVHVRPTYHVNTIDGDGMQAALNKHSDQLQRHFENAVRKMNI